MRIGVIGGGIAGLTAAYRLVKAGHQVYLFETEKALGGLAQAVDFAGTKLDKFYRHVFKSDIDIIALINELKLSDRFLWLPSSMGFYYGGKAYRFSTPMDLIRFKPLPFIDRIKAGLMSLYLQKVKNWKKYEKITVKEWVEKYVSKKVYEVIWGPLLEQKFAEKADKVAMTFLYGRLHSRMASREKGGAKEVLGYMKGSYQVLIDVLENEITKEGAKILKATSVSKVITENNKVKGIKVQGKDYNVDMVVVTCAPAITRKIIDFNNPEYEQKLEKLIYHGALILIMRTKKSLSDVYWLNIADKDSPFVAVVEHTNFMDKEEYGGDNIIYIGKYLSTDDPLYKLPAAEIKEKFFAHLKKIKPLFDEDDVIEWAVYREPFSQPVVLKEYSKIIPDYRTPVENLYMANMSMIYPEDRGMSYSVMLGNNAAKIMIEDAGKEEE